MYVPLNSQSGPSGSSSTNCTGGSILLPHYPVSMAAFNVADYGLSPDYPPDKESFWHYPPEEDGWCQVHRALKGEISMFADAFDAIKSRNNKDGLLEWEVTSIKTAFAGHFEHVHWHHHDEDESFVPFIKTRVKYPEKLESDHPTIEAQCDKIKSMIESLKEGDTVDDIIPEWKKYGDLICPHMDEEEATALLLLRAYFKPEDLKPVIEYIMANGPKIEMGSCIYFMGVDKFYNEFMKQEGIPFFVWYIDFQFRLREFEKRVAKHIDALKSGEEPPEASTTRCIIL